MQVALLDVAKSLQYSFTMTTLGKPDACCCVCYAADGGVFTGSKNGIRKFNSNYLPTKFTGKCREVTDIAECGNRFFVLYHTYDKTKVSELKDGFSSQVTLFHIADIANIKPYKKLKMAVSKAGIVITGCNWKALFAYGFFSRACKKLVVPQHELHFDVCFTSKTSLLVVGSDRLSLYDLKTETVMWLCDQLSDAHHVTSLKQP